MANTIVVKCLVIARSKKYLYGCSKCWMNGLVVHLEHKKEKETKTIKIEKVLHPLKISKTGSNLKADA